MTNKITGHTREQILEAHSLASVSNTDTPIPTGTKMVTVLSLIAEEHREYVQKEYSAVAVEIDGIKFMLHPSQLVPEGRTKILPSRVRSSDDADGNDKPVPAGFGVGAGGELVQIPKQKISQSKPKQITVKEVKMKNNTLHKQLKELQDMWINSEVSLFEHKLALATGACDVPENYEAVANYVKVDLKEMLAELKENIVRVNAKRKRIMEAFPYSAKERKLARKIK